MARLAALGLAAAVSIVLGALAAEQKPAPLPTGDDDEVAARALDTSITWKDLDVLLIRRRAMSKDGREALHHLAESKLLEVLGKENGIVLKDAELELQIKELSRQALTSGDKEGLQGFLKKGRLTREEFEHLLRLAYVEKVLTRRALGLGDDKDVTGEQQRLWMDDALAERAFEEFPPPWKDGVAAKSASFTIGAPEFVRYLRLRLPPETLREDCYQMLLQKRMLARMPDLAPEKLAQYVQAEIQRRRGETKADPKYKGIPYENLLSSQGILVEHLDEDPMIRIAALARVWVDRKYAPDDLKHVYSDEREYFDGTCGPAVETYMLFVRAAQFKNDLNPRTFPEAVAMLEEMKRRIRTVEEFKALAKEKSEDAQSREAAGALGYLTPLAQKIPPEIKAEITHAIATPASASAEGSLAGPLRVSNGCVLLWFGSRRPAPSWDAMAANVQRELRRRFVDEVLPRSALSTVFESP
jgi:hypothetical protein